MTVIFIVAGIVGIIAVLLAIAAIRAVIIKREQGAEIPFDPEKDGINPEKHANDLSRIIQIPTVSLRGSNDKTRIYRLHALFEELFPDMYRVCEFHDIEGALLFLWKGKNRDKNPILLMSHQDVVEAVGKWSHEPFSGDISGGKIWGRGTVDTKGSLCAILESVNSLIAEGFTPECDVYVASSYNEEITGDGAVKTVDYLYDKGVKLDLVMDEGGTVMSALEDGKMVAHTAMIGFFEKGRANIKFLAHSHGGHASVPFKNNPFARLSKLVYIVEHRNPFKKRITKPARIQYRAMAPYMHHFRHRFLYGNLWLFAPIAPYYMHSKSGPMGAVVKTTCIFTMAEGSHGANVIPECATMTANCRFMIHEPLLPSYKKLGKICKKLDIEMEMLTGFDVLPPANIDCYAYRYLGQQIKKTFGDIPQIPYIMLAGTDARHYTKICDCVLRFVPMMFTKEQLNSAHAVNENVSIAALERAIVFYRDFIRGYGKE